MTREEAIEYLAPIAVSAVLPRYKEALGLAIAALKVVDFDQVKNEPLTNADRIRAMSDEELAEWHETCPYINEECTMKGCEKCVLDWLQQPAEATK